MARLDARIDPRYRRFGQRRVTALLAVVVLLFGQALPPLLRSAGGHHHGVGLADHPHFDSALDHTPHDHSGDTLPGAEDPQSCDLCRVLDGFGPPSLTIPIDRLSSAVRLAWHDPPFVDGARFRHGHSPRAPPRGA